MHHFPNEVVYREFTNQFKTLRQILPSQEESLIILAKTCILRSDHGQEIALLSQKVKCYLECLTFDDPKSCAPLKLQISESERFEPITFKPEGKSTQPAHLEKNHAEDGLDSNEDAKWNRGQGKTTSNTSAATDCTNKR
jgi:hypothetical protein